jgi:hypothetical protein
MFKRYACLVTPLLLARCVDGRGFAINPKGGGRVY